MVLASWTELCTPAKLSLVLNVGTAILLLVWSFTAAEKEHTVTLVVSTTMVLLLAGFLSSWLVQTLCGNELKIWGWFAALASPTILMCVGYGLLMLDEHE